MAGQQGRLLVWSSLNRHRHESSPVGEELGDVDERGSKEKRLDSSFGYMLLFHSNQLGSVTQAPSQPLDGAFALNTQIEGRLTVDVTAV